MKFEILLPFSIYFLLASILAAIMSTADSQLLVAASSIRPCFLVCSFCLGRTWCCY